MTDNAHKLDETKQIMTQKGFTRGLLSFIVAPLAQWPRPIYGDESLPRLAARFSFNPSAE